MKKQENLDTQSLVWLTFQGFGQQDAQHHRITPVPMPIQTTVQKADKTKATDMWPQRGVPSLRQWHWYNGILQCFHGSLFLRASPKWTDSGLSFCMRASTEERSDKKRFFLISLKLCAKPPEDIHQTWQGQWHLVVRLSSVYRHLNPKCFEGWLWQLFFA